MNHCAGWIFVLSFERLFFSFGFISLLLKMPNVCPIIYHVNIIISYIWYIFKSWTPFDLLCLAGCVFAFEIPGVLGYLVQVQSITLTMMILMLQERQAHHCSSFTCYIISPEQTFEVKMCQFNIVNMVSVAVHKNWRTQTKNGTYP